MKVKEEIKITEKMSDLEFCERIATTTVWSYTFCVEFLDSCKNDRELFLECYNFSMYNSASPYRYLSEINNLKNNQVEINIIRGNAEELGKDTEKSSIAVKQTINDVFFKSAEEERNNSFERIIQNIFDVSKKKKKPIKQLFIEFLKREQVIFRYINNWDKSMFPVGTPIKNPRLYLCAFCWWKVPEGMQFWQDIETKWYECLENSGR